jgi:hypothetical protein
LAADGGRCWCARAANRDFTSDDQDLSITANTSGAVIVTGREPISGDLERRARSQA